ncbi:murein biosynthesis integral membrane protein MurJ [Nocardioides sp. MH1]|uniref:murein biosynthesis integral membrane protein MurJ n=1 Tax=Nocardioides sp. MH1 TaxID=3242490 RepID=UPI003520E132
MTDPTGPSGDIDPTGEIAAPDEVAVPEQVADPGEQRGILASSAVMAAGTVVSRFSGFIRSTLLLAALGGGLHADLFTIANTVPNMLYILLAGGVFNAVLVPQLVRAMKSDADGGMAYVDRVVTLATLFLGAVTVLLVLAAPWVMRLLLDSQFNDAGLAEQRQSAVDFARYCLPQVFFYGMFVLVGQVLNARGRFGPMMWAPIANNVIAVGVLVVYLFAFGPASPGEQHGAFSGSEELLLGIGSTLGIAAQFFILVPYLRSAGISIRPRFDFRGTGLGHTLRLGVWTVLFVVVNQAAYVVVVRLASGGTAASSEGTGITIYSSAQLAVMVPHSIITVSLATAILPRLSAHAAAGDAAALSRTLVSTVRTALAVVVPFAVLLPLIALDTSQVLWGHGATAATYPRFETTVSLFGIGVVFFTLHYLTLRGFYALEQNRTVFLIQCVIAAVNIVAALVLVGRTDPDHTSPMLVIAYTIAYGVGSLISFTVLSRQLSELPLRPMLGFVARLLVAAAAGLGAAWVVDLGLDELLSRAPGAGGWWWAAVEVMVLGLVDVVVLLLLARPLHLREITSVVDTVAGRLRRR